MEGASGFSQLFLGLKIHLLNSEFLDTSTIHKASLTLSTFFFFFFKRKSKTLLLLLLLSLQLLFIFIFCISR